MMRPSFVAVPDVVMIWKCSVPVIAGAVLGASADAPAGPATTTAAPAAATVIATTAARLRALPVKCLVPALLSPVSR